MPTLLMVLLALIGGMLIGQGIAERESDEMINNMNRVWNIGFQEGVVCGSDYKPSNVTVEECITIVRYNGRYVQMYGEI